MSQLGSAAWRGSALRQAAPARRPGRQRAALCFSNADGSVSVNFHLPYRCKYGQKLCLVGSNDVLGGWHVDRAVPMNWTEGDIWTVELQLPATHNGNGVQLEYKYVVRSERDKSAVRWKEGNNCYLTLPAQGRLHVRDTWDDSMREVEFETHNSASAAANPAPPSPPPPQPQLQPPAPAADAAAPAARRGRPRKIDEQAQVVATISKAADKAMQQLDDAVSRSLDLLGNSSDPAAPELLAADRLLAAAAKRATTMHKALEAAKEVKALPPTKPPRVRRKSGSKDGGDGQA